MKGRYVEYQELIHNPFVVIFNTLIFSLCVCNSYSAHQIAPQVWATLRYIIILTI